MASDRKNYLKGMHGSVAISPGVTEFEKRPGKLRDHAGYKGVNNGNKVWDATR